MAGRIRVGVGGWTFEPWRGSFFPEGLAHRRELEFASRAFGTLEINGTFYGSQKPATFQKWHDETPDDFVFAVKAPRFATNRRVLSEAGDSINRFFESGVMRLGEKLGPVNWQLMATKKFDPEDFAGFLALLPKEAEGRRLRHAVEVRHASFAVPELVALARSHGVAVVVAGDSDYPQIADPTAPFVFARIMGTSPEEPEGYGADAVRAWAERTRVWAEGGVPEDLNQVDAAPEGAAGRDVFLYVISGHKERNPAAALAIQAALAGG